MHFQHTPFVNETDTYVDSTFVESSKESTEARRPSKKNYILHSKCSHSMDSCKDLRAMVNKHKQKKTISEAMERAKESPSSKCN